jgi:uncharacterized glyoxalase superfamily protein PhnB
MQPRGLTPILNVSNILDTFAWFDVDAVHRRCVEQGIEITWPPTNMPWNVREMHVRHPDGHVFRISQGTEREETGSRPPKR